MWQSLLGLLSSTYRKVQRPQQRRDSGFRPAVEVLEGRIVPSGTTLGAPGLLTQPGSYPAMVGNDFVLRNQAAQQGQHALFGELVVTSLDSLGRFTASFYDAQGHRSAAFGLVLTPSASGQVGGPVPVDFQRFGFMFTTQLVSGTGVRFNGNLDVRFPDVHGSGEFLQGHVDLSPGGGFNVTNHPQQGAALAGQGSGNFTSNVPFHDLRQTFVLSGTADLAYLGHVAVSGSVQALGFVQQGHARGRLIFTNREGSVTIELTGPLQPGLSALPHSFHYRVVTANGDFNHLTEEGTLRLDLRAAPMVPGSNSQHGTFTFSV